MYSKIQISGTIEVVTGMHIGGSEAFAAIGAIDSPVMKDSITNLPMIPGSSLKGKMRTLLAKKYNEKPVKPEDDAENITRLFGSSKSNKDRKVAASRVLFSDMVLSNEQELRDKEVAGLTEVKFENTIIRTTAIANPRQIERVIRGAKFDLDIIYEATEENDIVEDMELLAEGMKLLQYDYIGGHGSRGYGKIKFTDVAAEVVIGDIDDDIMQQVESVLSNFAE